MAITSVHTDGEIDNVRSLWSAGGAGTMTMRWDEDLLAESTLVFDQG